ncbi:hypothetical protein FRB96_009425 [Tulasnella sp. 330]|nr:hypothetical protein FRB96_009425 [Tulasnella sp. 330]
MDREALHEYDPWRQGSALRDYGEPQGVAKPLSDLAMFIYDPPVRIPPFLARHSSASLYPPSRPLPPLPDQSTEEQQCIRMTTLRWRALTVLVTVLSVSAIAVGTTTKISPQSTTLVAASSNSTTEPTATTPPTTATTAVFNTTTTAPIPVGTTASPTVSDLMTLYKQRVPIIAEAYPVSGASQLDSWLAVLSPNGTYSTVDYTTGCTARTANWPAEIHWINTVSLASAYVNAYAHNASLMDKAPNDFIKNATVKADLDLAMNWWFANDFTELDCLDEGGVAGFNCPCGTPGMWNKNWFDSVIYIPRPATQTCVLLNATITPAQRTSCVLMGQRSFDTFARYGVFGLNSTSLQSWEAGANIMDIASIGVNVGLLRYFGGDTTGLDVISTAYDFVHNEVIIQPDFMADGIRPDGSFGQHVGVLYNGESTSRNYGFDYIVLVLSLELSAAGTVWQGNDTTISAVETLVDGSQWMIYKNVETDVLHWDFNTLGRFVTFASSDVGQASAGIEFNLTQVLQLGTYWNSTSMVTAATDLTEKSKGANAGKLNGNRMFWINDYMVHRGLNYVTTVKMVSDRTKNSECLNAQNPFGFHMGQGTSYTYVIGTEYENITNAWDWNIAPGITTDYGATFLNCSTVQVQGNRTFVGGASDGNIGVAAMDYVNPLTHNFTYRKSWFFFEDDVEHVLVWGITSNDSAPVYSVLDQKRYNGPIYIDGKKLPEHTGQNKTGVASLWHSQVGYTFANSSLDGESHQLSVTVANRTGNWSTIGISAVPGLPTEELFAGLIQHPSTNLSEPLAYSVYPGTTSYSEFERKSKYRRVTTIRNDGSISAVLDKHKGVAMAVFWNATGGLVDFPSVSVASDNGVIVILDTFTGNLTYADPTQTLLNATVTLKKLTGSKKHFTVPLTFLQGETAGKSSTVLVKDW